MSNRLSNSTVAAALLLVAPQAYAVSGLDLSIGAQQYATESTPGSRVDLKAGLRTEATLTYHGVDSHIPVRQADLFLIYESGAAGERGLDIDSLAQRWGFGSGHAWIGRTHPLTEGRARATALPTSAVGASWVQNQGNALEPRVSGWIGAGVHVKSENGTFATLAYSPLFLPSFGPRLDFSDTAPAQGSRFSRLPPQFVQLENSNPIPLYYRINAGDITKIVLQDQAWLSFGRELNGLRAEAMLWSAPSPNPSVATETVLKSGAADLDVLVTVHPSFLRETFVGGALESNRPSLATRLELLNETTSGRWIVSARISPLRSLELGYLNTFNRPAPAPSADAVSSPIYANQLFWLNLASPDGWKLRPSLRIEQQPGQGGWVRPSVDWAADSNVRVFANVSVLTGAENTYFGSWRTLDSVSMGARISW